MNITVGSGTQQTGTAQIVSVEFEQGTDVHTRQERNPNYDVNAPAGSPNSNYYITVTYTRKCWYVDHCIVTVKGNSTKYGNYTGNTIDTLSTTTVDINGSWTGQPNYSLPGNWSGTAHLKVKDNHPKYDYRITLDTDPASFYLCINETRGSTYNSKPIKYPSQQLAVKLEQRTCTGYIGAEQWGDNWEVANTTVTDFTWTSADTSKATINTSGVLTSTYSQYNKADTTVNITVAINANTKNKQGIVYTATQYGGTKASLTKTLDQKAFNILGRADLYEYRVIIVGPTSVVYINDGGTYQCNAKLQERKNEGKTGEGGYTWTDYDSTNSHFNWTVITNNGSITINTNGLATGRNRYYYPGLKTATPGYTGAPTQTAACESAIKATYNQTITKNDTLHNCAAKVVINPNNADTASIRVRGYMTYYCFYVVNNLTSSPSPAKICINNSRTDVSGYSTTCSFTAIAKYKYRKGTVDSYQPSEEFVLDTSGTDYSWSSSPSNSGYFTISNGSITCTGTNASSFNANRSDITFTITATIKSAATSNKYNIDNSLCTSNNSGTGSLQFYAREDEYACGSVSLNKTSVTINDGASTGLITATMTYSFNGNTQTALASDIDWNWTSWADAPGDVSVIITYENENAVEAQGTNKYFNYSQSIYNGYVKTAPNFKSSKTFTGKFGRVYHLDCHGVIQCDVNVRGHTDEYTYDDYRCESYPSTLQYNQSSSTLTASVQKKVKAGTITSWSWVNYGSRSTSASYVNDLIIDGNYINRGGSSGSFYVIGNYPGTNTYGTQTSDAYMRFSAADDVEHNELSCRFTVTVYPQPDSYNVDYDWVSFYSSLSSGQSDYASVGAFLKCNGTTIETYYVTDYDIEMGGAGLDDWSLNPPYNVYVYAATVGANDYETFWWSISLSGGSYSYQDRNYSINHITHTGTISFHRDGTIRVNGPTEYYLTVYSGTGNYRYSNPRDFAFSWEDDLGDGGPCGDGDDWGSEGDYVLSSRWTYLDWRVQAEWEDSEGLDGTQTQRGSARISWSGYYGSVSLPDLYFG